MKNNKEMFEEAANEAAALRDKPSNETLLLLYSLFKQSTEGDNLKNPPENPFDFVAKAKYEAWKSQSGKSKEAAMKEYISLVDKLKN